MPPTCIDYILKYGGFAVSCIRSFVDACERARHGFSDAGRGSGDDGDFALESVFVR